MLVLEELVATGRDDGRPRIVFSSACACTCIIFSIGAFTASSDCEIGAREDADHDLGHHHSKLTQRAANIHSEPISVPLS
jgi:uncharacterized protein YfcZ (UPF0381/DUF406 family)